MMENQTTINSVPSEPQQNTEQHVTIPDYKEEEDNVDYLIRKARSFSGAEKEEDEEDRISSPTRNEKGKSILLGEGTNPILTRRDEEGSQVARQPLASASTTTALDHEIQQEARREERNAGQIGDEDETQICSNIELRLGGRLRDEVRQDEARTSTNTTSNTSPCIFRIPHKLVGINQNACQPELVAIGPYHKGKTHMQEWEEHKLYFLTKYLLRSPPEASSSSNSYNSLLKLRVHKIGRVEKEARESYSGIQNMSSHDFIQMMLVDGCFVVELLYHLNHNGDVIDKDDPIFTRPELIPILMRDLLKLENQIPYFILELLVDPELYPCKELQQPFHLLALEVFNLVFERPLEILKKFDHHESKNLLDLFRFSLLPLEQASTTNISYSFFSKLQLLNLFLSLLFQNLFHSQSTDRSVECVTHLRPSGIKFKSKNNVNFLAINFQNNVLEIPSITVDEFLSTILINCVALEQTLRNTSKYFTDYVFFMGCLVSKPRDARFLFSDGIITKYSRDDKYVADLLNTLGQNVGSISRDSYLSKHAINIELYYTSPLAVMRRKYYSDPLSFLSFYAILILILTLVQTIMAILSYIHRKDR